MQSLIVSMLRFSAAVTLFSMEQLQSSLNLVEGEENLSKTLERFEEALNSVTDSLTKRIDEKKKDTLKSITKMSEDVVGRTFDGMTMIDPREMMRATNDLIQKTSDTTAGWVSKAASAVEKATETVKSSEKAG
jgi:conjugal transfer/entry exclusion protein